MKAAYEFIAGNSFVTPVGLALAVLAAYLLEHARLPYAGLALVVILLATLTVSVFERVN